MKNNSGGALLFAIITAFVLTLVATSIVFLSSNQYRIVDSEVDRTRAFYRAQAGVEFAINWAIDHPTEINGFAVGHEEDITPSPVPDTLSGATIYIIRINPAAPDPFDPNLGQYGIRVDCLY